MIRRLLRAVLPQRMRLTSVLAGHIDRVAEQRVVAGPFRGNRCSSEAVGSVQRPKILGTYELELHAGIEEICAAAPATIVVAGAAEGYYAVGLALRLPETRVVAYEANPRGRELLAGNRESNGLSGERLEIRDICTVSRLAADLAGTRDAWLIMDVEGTEAVLADPEVIPDLMHTQMLIEVHEFALPGVGELLKQRFGSSHDVVEIMARERVAADFPPALWPEHAASMYEGAAVALMNEQRPAGMSWLLMRSLKR